MRLGSIQGLYKMIYRVKGIIIDVYIMYKIGLDLFFRKNSYNNVIIKKKKREHHYT